jgi:integrase/recombinase XerD
MLTNSIKT